MMFSFETKQSPNQTKIVVNSPINKSYAPRIISFIIVITFFLFFITELISFLQNFTFTKGLGISIVGVAFSTLVCIIVLSRFVCIYINTLESIQKSYKFPWLNAQLHLEIIRVKRKAKRNDIKKEKNINNDCTLCFYSSNVYPVQR